MSLIKQLIPSAVKFTPASSEVNWTKIETLVHGPGAGSSSNKSDVNSALFACLMTVAMAYPEPPLCVFQKNATGKASKLPDHPLQDLVDYPAPNGELDSGEMGFWTAWAKHVDGNAYWLKVRSGNALTGNVVELWPISPSLMTPRTIEGSGDWISHYEYQDKPNHTVNVPVANVIHFRLGLDDKDMRKGLSPLKALVRQISTDEEADKFVDALLKNYAVPGLVVIPAQGVTLREEDADLISTKMSRKFGNENRGHVATMSKEAKIEQFGFSPKDLDMSILHRIPEERISAVVGVPAIVAGLGAGLDRATYANFSEAREMFTEQKMIPQWRADAKKLNTSLKPDFSSDRNIYLEHDLTDVRALQEDEDSKYTRLSTAVKKPFMTRNEARSDIGLDPKPGWDEEDTAPPPPPTVPQNGNNQNNQNNQNNNGNRNQNQQSQQRALDLDRWQRKAIRLLSEGKSAAEEFESDYIPASIAGAILGALEATQTEDEVKAIFTQIEAWEEYP